MKTLNAVLILLLCILFANRPVAQMRQLHLDNNDLNDVRSFSFYSPSEGYVGFAQYVGYTTDSGRSFTKKYITFSNVNYNGFPVNLTFGFGIDGVKAFNRDTLIVYGDYGLVPSILYSTDQGNSFKLVYHDRYDPFSFKSGITDMVFPQNTNVGFAVEADRILKTTNRGLTWSVIKLDVDRYFENLEAVDDNNVIAFSKGYSTSKLYKTSNGGTSWTDVSLPAGKIGYAQFITPLKGWLNMRNADQQGVVYYTSNGGISWIQKNDPTITSFFCDKFQFENDRTGYAISGLFEVYKTSDSGRIWEPLPRDKEYTYLGYSHYDMQLMKPGYLWAGGGHGLIESAINGGGDPLPKALFKVDTTGLSSTGIVSLVNYSKSSYSFKWLRNDTLISTSYHASFIHDRYQFNDTISLVVSNGKNSDTLVNYIAYPKVWITGFTPTSSIRGGTVTITGYNFSGAYHVKFGGVYASSFKVISNTQINAVLGNGASGEVEVFTPSGLATLGGFEFLGPPVTDLPIKVSDTVLCKSERIKVTIENTEQGVLYELLNHPLMPVLGSVEGNGGTVSFFTSPISENGNYRVRATRIGTIEGYIFNKTVSIQVEHTKARFVADQVNVLPGEVVNFAAQKGEAQNYYWIFNEDASALTASGEKVNGITYSRSGQKSLQLIAVSSNECRDTINSNAVFVYDAPQSNAGCYINPLDFDQSKGMAMSKAIGDNKNAVYVIGATANSTRLNSRIGRPKEFGAGSQSFFAKYNSDGVLKWVHHFLPGGGNFTDAQTDALGNVYLTGYASSTQFLYFNNGDSMQLYALPADTTYMGQRTNGFIMKLDGNGKLLWHTILYDHIVLWQGYAASCSATQIAINGDHIMVIGRFSSKLSYARNGVIKELFNMPGGYGREANYALLKIRNDGELLWDANIYYRANNYHYLSDISVDKAGNSYIVGTYEEYLAVRDADSTMQVELVGNVAYHRAYMLKYDVNGKVKWYNNFVSSYQYGDAGLNKVVADDDGNTYVAGHMFNWGQVYHTNITHSDGTVAKDTVSTFALYKFDVNGKRLWGVGSRSSYYGEPGALLVKDSSVYVAANIYNNGKEFSSFQISSADGNAVQLDINDDECFIAEYDTKGTFKRIVTSGDNYYGMPYTPTSLHMNSRRQFVLSGNIATYIGGRVNGLFNVPWPNQEMERGDGFFMTLDPDFCRTAVTANAGADKSVCAGDAVAIGTKAYGDYYSWTSTSGYTSSLANPQVRPEVNTNYYLEVTNSKGDKAYDTVLVTVKSKPIADAGADTTACAGSSITIRTADIAGYRYQWYALPSSSVISYNAMTVVKPASNATYYVRVTNANECSVVDTVKVSTLSQTIPTVAITGADTSVCSGTPVQFNSSVDNAQTVSGYQWQVNGVDVGVNMNQYMTDSLKNNDVVTLSVTYSDVCTPLETKSSNSIIMNVKSLLNAMVTLSGNGTVKEGESASIVASVMEATDYTLQWQDSTSSIGWQDLQVSSVPGSINYKPLKSGDKIRCKLTVRDACVAANTIYSAPIEFVVNKVTAIEPMPAAQYGLIYYPNPTHNTLIIDSLRVQDQWQHLEIKNLDGGKTLLQLSLKNASRVTVPVSGFTPGMYVATLRNRKGKTVYLKFLKI